MTKYANGKTLELLDGLLERLPEIATYKIVQSMTLAIKNPLKKNFQWYHHPEIEKIKSKNYTISRVGLECNFYNQVVGLKHLRQRSYNWNYFVRNQCHELYQDYFQLSPESKNGLDRKRYRNMFVYADSLTEEDIYFCEYFKSQNTNKIICYPSTIGINVDPKLQSFCIDNNLRLLPMKQLSVQNVLQYIVKNYRGNVLLNEAVDGKGDYMISPKNQRLQPRGFIGFCDFKEQEGQMKEFLEFKKFMLEYVMNKKRILNKDSLFIFDMTRVQDYITDEEEEQESSTDQE